MKSALLSRFLIILAATAFVGVGCKKLNHTSNSTVVTVSPDQPPKPVSGAGGTASFRIIPNHNGIDIDSCMVYIKYDAAVVPADKQYDDSVKAMIVDGKPIARFDNLLPGNYYLFGNGWDLVRSEHVHGGLPFVILEENKSTTHTFTLPLEQYSN